MCFSYLLHRDWCHTQLHNSGVLSQRKDRFHRSVPGNVRAGILEERFIMRDHAAMPFVRRPDDLNLVCDSPEQRDQWIKLMNSTIEAAKVLQTNTR